MNTGLLLLAAMNLQPSADPIPPIASEWRMALVNERPIAVTLSGTLKMDSRIPYANVHLALPPDTPFQSFQVPSGPDMSVRKDADGRSFLVIRRTQPGPISVTLRGTVREYEYRESLPGGDAPVSPGKGGVRAAKPNKCQDYDSPRFRQLLQNPPGLRANPRNGYEALTAKVGLIKQPDESRLEFQNRLRWFFIDPEDPKKSRFKYVFEPSNVAKHLRPASQLLAQTTIDGDCLTAANLVYCINAANGIGASVQFGRMLKDGTLLTTGHVNTLVELEGGVVVFDLVKTWRDHLSGYSGIVALHENMAMKFSAEPDKGFTNSGEVPFAQDFFTPSGPKFRSPIPGVVPVQQYGTQAGWWVEGSTTRVQFGRG